MRTLALLGVMGALGWAGYWYTQRSAPAVMAFADGTRLEHLGTTVGDAAFTTDRRLFQWARQVLPRRWQGWIPPVRSGRCSSGTNSITCYFQLVGNTGGSHPWTSYCAEDTAGFRYPMEGGYCGFGGGGSQQVVGLTLRSFPRRQRSFTLVFFGRDREELGRIRLANPVRGPFPVWFAEPLPLTRTNGPVALTLEGLAWRGEQKWYPMVPRWRLRASEPAWEHAQIGWVEVADPTGNSGNYASREEPVWRLRTSVTRQRWEDFAPDEILVVTNRLPIPAAGDMVAVDAVKEVEGRRLTLGAVCGPGTLYITNQTARGMALPSQGDLGSGMTSSGSTVVEHWGCARPFLFLEVAGMGDRDRIYWRAFDDQGQEYALTESHGYSSRSGSRGRVYTLEFQVATNGVAARFEAVVSRALEFEFDVASRACEPDAGPPPRP